MSTTWTITGFNGINNMQDPANIDDMKASSSYGKVTGGSGTTYLTKCINYDIDDAGGLIKRDDTQVVFTAEYDAKLTQRLGALEFTAFGDTLRYKIPFQTSYNDRRSSIKYDSAITLIQEVEEGMWVCTTNKIYFHRGKNPAEIGGFTQTAEYDFSAIMGTGEKVHNSKLGLDGDSFVAIFSTTKGICYGTSGGKLVNMSESIFSYIPGQRGISYIKEANGMIQYQVKMLNDIGEEFNKQEPRVPVTIDAQ